MTKKTLKLNGNCQVWKEYNEPLPYVCTLEIRNEIDELCQYSARSSSILGAINEAYRKSGRI